LAVDRPKEYFNYQKIPKLFMEPLIEFHKRYASPYFYFANLKKESQISLSPLTSGEHEIFYKKGILANCLRRLTSGTIPSTNHHTT